MKIHHEIVYFENKEGISGLAYPYISDKVQVYLRNKHITLRIDNMFCANITGESSLGKYGMFHLPYVLIEHTTCSKCLFSSSEVNHCTVKNIDK